MSVQLIIIIAYFALTVFISAYFSRGSKGSDSFHGAGLGVMMIVCASTGEWLGGTSTTGVSEYGFDFGISGSWYTIANSMSRASCRSAPQSSLPIVSATFSAP